MSTSARITWDPAGLAAMSYKIYRATTNVFPGGTALATLSSAFTVYNDYTLSPATTYYYWVTRLIGGGESAPSAPASVTTYAAPVEEDALGDDQQLALWTWASSALGWLYQVTWANEKLPKQRAPRVVLNGIVFDRGALTDDVRDRSEQLSGSRNATISVNVSAEPDAAKRVKVSIDTLAAGDYTLTINGADFTVTFGGTPTAITVVAAFIAALDQNLTIDAWAAGQLGEILMIQNKDALATEITVTAAANMTPTKFTPTSALTLAQRLFNSVENPTFRQPLNDAEIGIDHCEAIQNLSEELDTEIEHRFQFDLLINLAANSVLSGPIIDTVITPIGTLTP